MFRHLNIWQGHRSARLRTIDARLLQEGRQAASGLLNSYIDFIEQYSKIATQRKQIQENGFEQKYYQLLADYNKNAQENRFGTLGYIYINQKVGVQVNSRIV